MVLYRVNDAQKVAFSHGDGFISIINYWVPSELLIIYRMRKQLASIWRTNSPAPAGPGLPIRKLSAIVFQAFTLTELTNYFGISSAFSHLFAPTIFATRKSAVSTKKNVLEENEIFYKSW